MRCSTSASLAVSCGESPVRATTAINGPIDGDLLDGNAGAVRREHVKGSPGDERLPRAEAADADGFSNPRPQTGPVSDAKVDEEKLLCNLAGWDGKKRQARDERRQQLSNRDGNWQIEQSPYSPSCRLGG